MLYHYTIGFPKNIALPVGRLRLRYGRHALEAAKTDRYGCLILPNSVQAHQLRIIEMEVVDGQVVKFVARMPYNAANDLVLVIAPHSEQGCWFVRTVWVNKRNDTHSTLRRWLYTTPESE